MMVLSDIEVHMDSRNSSRWVWLTKTDEWNLKYIDGVVLRSFYNLDFWVLLRYKITNAVNQTASSTFHNNQLLSM